MLVMAQYKVAPHWTACDDCKGWFDPNEHPACILPVDTVGYATRTICFNCAKFRHLAVCDGCSEVRSTGELNGCGDYNYCDDCAFMNDYAECVECGVWLHNDDQYDSPGRDTHCEECYHERYDTCEGCSEVFYRDELSYSEYHECLFCRRCDETTDDFSPVGFRDRSGRTTCIGSERCFGLELETDDCNDYFELEGSAAWGAKNDSSVRGKEFYSDVLSGDDGLAAVAELTEFAEANNWDTDARCGYHLHLDMRNESDDSLFAAAYAYRATQSVWYSLVDKNRPDYHYCYSARWTCADVVHCSGSFTSFLSTCNILRTTWINLQAYNKFETFEVRLHQGTLDKDAVCNWIKAHTRFVDWACTAGLAKVRKCLDGKDTYELLDFIMDEVWRDDELRTYYADRACIGA